MIRAPSTKEPPLLFVDPHLPRELFGWHSPRLGKHMPIARYGTFGPALLLLPTAQADYLEYERFWLIKAIEHHIFDGRVTVFTIDSINEHAWMNEHIPPWEKARRQAAYSGYIENEVVPHIRRCLQNPEARIAVSGASFGAFHAANQFFRRPDLFDTLIAMSGFYDISGYTDGYFDENVYFNNPMAYVQGINDARTHDLLQHSQIHLLTGQGDYERPELTRKFSQLLWDKGIWHNADYWGHDMKHDWPTWLKMLDFYIGHRLGW
jgi:esterase/lipase superfamily enzyme